MSQPPYEAVVVTFSVFERNPCHRYTFFRGAAGRRTIESVLLCFGEPFPMQPRRQREKRTGWFRPALWPPVMWECPYVRLIEPICSTMVRPACELAKCPWPAWEILAPRKFLDPPRRVPARKMSFGKGLGVVVERPGNQKKRCRHGHCLEI